MESCKSLQYFRISLSANLPGVYKASFKPPVTAQQSVAYAAFWAETYSCIPLTKGPSPHHFLIVCLSGPKHKNI